MEKFNFFKSFLDTARAIQDDKLRLEYLMAVAEYWLEGKESDNPMVKALMVQTQFVLDRGKELMQLKSECMKWNQNAVKTFEKGIKQRKTEQNREKQKKQEIEIEKEIEVEKEYMKKETDKEKTMCNKLHDPTLWFDKFWNEYPVKKDKKKAMEKYSKLSSDKKRLAIEWISKLKQSEQWKRWYIPLPTTYLNGERREDEVENVSWWLELIKERERERIRAEAQEILNRNRGNNEQSIQDQWVDRRTSVAGC